VDDVYSFEDGSVDAGPGANRSACDDDGSGVDLHHLVDGQARAPYDRTVHGSIAKRLVRFPFHYYVASVIPIMV